MTTIFVDFDGTITEQDLLDRIAQTFGDPEVYREVDEGLDERRLSLHEVLRREFEPVRAPLEEVVAWVLEHATIRTGFHIPPAQALSCTRRAKRWVSPGFTKAVMSRATGLSHKIPGSPSLAPTY